jgi:hypothetical protein
MKTTQTERLLNYLRDNKSIDPLESWKELGIYRLSAVVFELRKDGYRIATDKKKVLNKFGESCSVANYKLNQNEI